MNTVGENLASSRAEVPAASVAPRASRRRRFQFRLRTLLVLLTLCAFCFALLAAQWRQHQAEMAALRGLGATGFASSWGESWLRQKGRAPDPKQELLDARCVASVDVPQWLKTLRDLQQWAAKPTEDERREYVEFKLFGRVRLLRMFPRARIAPLDQDEKRYLATFGALEFLSIDARILEREDVEALATYSDLRRLALAGCTFAAAACEPLGALHRLRILDLNGSNVTDDDLAALAALKNLEILDLSHTEVTDEGLAHLGSLPKLRRLHLSGSRATDQGVDRLRQALPNLQLLDD
jgi:Leucine rich repeat